MSLRAKLSLAIALLVTLGVGGALIAAERYLSRAARLTLEDELVHSLEVYSSFLSERGARRVAEAGVVAEEPRLKAAVRTLDIDQATLEDVADELRTAAGAELFVLTDRAGETVADVSTPKLGVLAKRPGFTEVAQKGGGALIWAIDGQLFQVAVRPLQFGSDVTGYMLTGYPVTQEMLASARAQTGSLVTVLVGAKQDPALQAAPDGVSEVSLAGERFVVLKAPHPGAKGDAQVAIYRSLDQALAAHQAVRNTLLLIGLAAFILGLLAALGLARSLTGRLDRLAAAASAVGKGEKRVMVEVQGKDEVAKLSQAFNQMSVELEASRDALVRKERLEKELQIAQKIQTALLPRSLEAPGYRLAATMIPAENVGGDLYDVIVARDGHLWVCIGDVTSHGVTPGLIMMMVQSALSALVEASPAASPKDVLVQLNRVIYANVHERLEDDNYLTLTVLRSDGPGRFVFSGAHLDLLIKRAGGAIDRVPTPGVWVGLVEEIADQVEENRLELAAGDTLILHSDGLTESRDAAGKQLDLDGVTRALATARGAEACHQALLGAVKAHMTKQEDDITVVAIERVA